MRRIAVAALAGVAACGLYIQPASAEPSGGALTPIASCEGLESPGGGDAELTKTIIDVVYADGNATITFTLDSARPEEEEDLITRVRDCVFVDLNNNGVLDPSETAFGFDQNFGEGEYDAEAEYTVTIPAPIDSTICDRAAVSGQIQTETENPLPLMPPIVEVNDFTDKSDGFTCDDGGPPVVIPEAPLTVLLPLTAIALFGGGALFLRRRRGTVTA